MRLSVEKEKAIKTIHLAYYASLREARGLSQESLETDAATAGDLYTELKGRHGFRLPDDVVRVSLNNSFVSWKTALNDGDRVVFIPPVSGG